MSNSKVNKKSRILFTIPNFDTAGSGKALLNICKRLDKNYFQPSISCSHSKGYLFKEVIDTGIPFYLNQNQVNMIPRLRGIIKCYQLSKFFKKLNVDLIHSFHYGPDYSEALAANLAGIPWIYTKKNMNWGGSSKNGWKLRSMLSSHIILQNQDMKDLFFKTQRKTSIVYRGVNTNEFYPIEKKRIITKKYRILNREVVILSVANILPIKGIEILINSFKKLSKKYNFIRLFVVGNKETDYGRKIDAEVKNDRSALKIHFTGTVDKVIDYYSIANIFVLPTIKKGEGCPVSLLEAMACGITPVASNVSGIKDVLNPFPELMFSPGDVYSLTEKLESVILAKDDKKMIYRNHILKNYDIDIEVKNHIRIYKKLIGLN